MVAIFLKGAVVGLGGSVAGESCFSCLYDVLVDVLIMPGLLMHHSEEIWWVYPPVTWRRHSQLASVLILWVLEFFGPLSYSLP